jgi:hypothetical protein
MASTFLVTAVMDVAIGLEFGYVGLGPSLLSSIHPKLPSFRTRVHALFQG